MALQSNVYTGKINNIQTITALVDHNITYFMNRKKSTSPPLTVGVDYFTPNYKTVNSTPWTFQNWSNYPQAVLDGGLLQ
jgi:hypothetical protein